MTKKKKSCKSFDLQDFAEREGDKNDSATLSNSLCINQLRFRKSLIFAFYRPKYVRGRIPLKSLSISGLNYTRFVLLTYLSCICSLRRLTFRLEKPVSSQDKAVCLCICKAFYEPVLDLHAYMMQRPRKNDVRYSYRYSSFQSLKSVA